MPIQSLAGERTDLVIDRGAHTIRLTREFEASSEKIFECWTEAEHVTGWWDPAGEPLARCEIDLRMGGAFKFVTKGHPELPFAGVYREIAPPDRIVFETADAATGRVILQAIGGRTRMTVEIECRSADHLDQYLKMNVDVGTARTLDNLVDYARRLPK